MSLRGICSAMVMSLALSVAALAQSPRLTTTESMIQSSDPNIKLYVRNKHAEGMTSFSPDKTLLFIHGATYPAETSFDLPIEGVSMMDLVRPERLRRLPRRRAVVRTIDPSARNGSAPGGE
jgi:hypothetical protein